MTLGALIADETPQLIEGAKHRHKLLNAVDSALNHGLLKPRLEEQFVEDTLDKLNQIDECIEQLDIGTGDKSYLDTAKKLKRTLQNQIDTQNPPTRKELIKQEARLTREAINQTGSYLKRREKKLQGTSFIARITSDHYTIPKRAFRALKGVNLGAGAALMLVLTQQVVAGEVLDKKLPRRIDDEGEEQDKHKTRVHVEWPANTARRAEQEEIIRRAAHIALTMTGFSPTDTITIKIVSGSTGGAFKQGAIKINKDIFTGGPLAHRTNEHEVELRVLATVVHQIAHLCFAHQNPAAMDFHDQMDEVAHAQRIVDKHREAKKMYEEYVNGYLRETEQYAYNVEQEFLKQERELMQKKGLFHKHNEDAMAKLLAENEEALDEVAKKEVRRWEHEKQEFYGLSFLAYIFKDLSELEEEGDRPLNVDFQKYQERYGAPDEVVEKAMSILTGERIIATQHINHKTKSVRIEQRSYNNLRKFLLKTQEN